MSVPSIRLLLMCAVVSFAPLSVGQDRFDYPPKTLGDLVDRLSPYIEIQTPKGTGPFPAMVMVTGCSGFHNERFSSSYNRDGSRFIELGYAVARADYVRAHGLENSCTGAQNPSAEVVSTDEIARYIGATVAHMAGREDIDANRIYLIGWSLGGTGILTAIADIDRQPDYKIAAVLNYFPGCQEVSPWSVEVPMLLLLAELDNIVPPQYCQELVRNSPRRDMVEVIEYPEAHHCFIAQDTPVVKEPRSEATCAYNPDAYAASWQDILHFLSSI